MAFLLMDSPSESRFPHLVAAHLFHELARILNIPKHLHRMLPHLRLRLLPVKPPVRLGHLLLIDRLTLDIRRIHPAAHLSITPLRHHRIEPR